MRYKGQITIASYKDEAVLFGKYVSYNKDRDKEIYLYKLENPTATLQSIANMYGISRERVRQVLVKCGLNTSVSAKKDSVDAQRKIGS